MHFERRSFSWVVINRGKENNLIDIKRGALQMFEKYPDIVTIEQLQEMLGIGRNNIYKLLKENKIKHRKWGKNI